jgi:hypothetical protein
MINKPSFSLPFGLLLGRSAGLVSFDGMRLLLVEGFLSIGSNEGRVSLLGDTLDILFCFLKEREVRKK